MSQQQKKWIKFILRWGVAIAGLWYVISNISLYNRVLIPGPTGRPVAVRLVKPAVESDASFTIFDDATNPAAPVERSVSRYDLYGKSDLDKAVIRESDGSELAVEVLGLKVERGDWTTWPLVVGKPRSIWMRYLGRTHGDLARVVLPSQIVGGYHPQVPYPIIDQGLWVMTLQAMERSPGYLLIALFIFPVVYLITALRWDALLRALDINMTFPRAFALNMVGAFYNTFMPGSTGGDVLKAYYASKQTTRYRTRAVMSVIVDRIVGLLALVLLGGAVATYQYFVLPSVDPARHRCGQIAVGSVTIFAITFAGLLALYTRHRTGLDKLLLRLPMQRQLHKAIDAMEIYRRRPTLVLGALLMTLPVHATVVVSAMFSCMALGLPLQPGYYWVVVPVVVLAGSIPISPQGAGVMEFFAILLTRRQGCTISQAFALTMSIRIVNMLWNLTGSIFVLKGGYHVPTTREQEELEVDPA